MVFESCLRVEFRFALVLLEYVRIQVLCFGSSLDLESRLSKKEEKKIAVVVVVCNSLDLESRYVGLKSV